MNHINHKRNELGRDFVIGDLHGNYELLENKLNDINFDVSVDRIFSVGDLIDRGEESMRCLLLVRKKWFHAVRGNHEEMMLDNYNKGGDFATQHYMNGGDWYMFLDAEDRFECIDIIKRMPYAITIDNKIGICHAEPASFDWNDVYNLTPRLIDELLWGRHFMQTAGGVDNIGHTYHGHTGVKKPVTIGNSTFLDTAFVGGYLSCIEINYDND